MKFIEKQLGMFVSTCVANFFRLLIDASKFLHSLFVIMAKPYLVRSLAELLLKKKMENIRISALIKSLLRK